ncbi:DUF86 domain-containing protein [Spirulina major CS-329]|uniref:HepT-like ribonuclease domain-containing protein n=1 Tax=Spirulina TaxID=1154 RepID=UPI00232ABE6C|nr:MULTISPECIES: DUF86 domain-containing protein [Spirulina]MDB9494856.1 DUF86 domain-containing protein [Spirulina subsalsa CS-330]MDB9502528.1 DUF86 domain-containing protein [Spirulina major CS-329]
MSRQLSLYLNDILSSIAKIQIYASHLSYEELVADEKTLDAVTHNLLIIGEATKQIPDTLREQYPQIPWQQIAGIRDIIAHAYFTINPRIIWNVIQQELVPLQNCIQIILQTEI